MTNERTAGFLGGDEKSMGLYKELTGEYVRVFTNNTSFLGRIDYTSPDITRLIPHLVGIGTDLINRATIVENEPHLLKTDSITSIQALGEEGRAYLEQIVKDSIEQNSINKAKREKELKEVGYYNIKPVTDDCS